MGVCVFFLVIYVEEFLSECQKALKEIRPNSKKKSMIKCRFLLIMLFLLFLTGIAKVQAQTSLFITKKDNSQTVSLVSDVRKLTFPSGSVVLTKNDGSIQSYGIGDIKHISFIDYLTQTSILQSEDNTGLFIYPCPAKNELTVSLPATNEGNNIISIVNVQGQLVYKQALEKSIGTHSIKIDIANLTAGMYLLSLQNASKIETQKLIITNN